MNKCNLKLVIIILIAISPLRFSSAQEKTSSRIDSLQTTTATQTEKVNKELEITKSMIVRAEQDIELAGKIIDWSAIILTTLTVILVITGAIGLKEFSNIRKIESEMTGLNAEMRQEIENIKSLKSIVLNEIEELKNDISNESKNVLKIIYLLNEGMANYHSGNLTYAISAFKNVLKINPKDYDATCYLARSYVGQENYDYAIEIASSAIQLNDSPARAYVIIGEAYRRLGNFEKSIESFKQSIKYEKRSPVLNNLGYSFLYANDIQNAIKTFKDSLDHQRNNPTACCGLAKAYNKAGKTKEAREYFQESILLANEEISKGTIYVWPYYNLAFSYFSLDNIDQCLKYLNMALKINKNFSIIKEQMINYEDQSYSHNSMANADKCLALFNKYLQDN